MHDTSLPSRARSIATEVPEVTIFFWIIKILTTALGESTSDYLVFHTNPYLAVIGGFVAFVVAMVIQFAAKKYIPWIYWLAALMIAVFGTMAADIIHVVLGVPYVVSTIGFAIALIIIFALWYASEKTLSIHSIYTFRREVFYWATVLATFALGTATGDLTATTFDWGYLSSGIVFAAVIAVIALVHFIFKAVLGSEHRHLSRNAVFAFWLMLLMTQLCVFAQRPCGSFGDTQPSKTAGQRG
jgi:uncharacterized membrane-anchored protein